LAKRPESRKNADTDARDARGRRKPEELLEASRRRYDSLESFDRSYSERGFAHVAGVDEVGRGALAGPVVCAAVVLPRESGLVGVDDSKALEAGRREAMFERIVAAAESIRIAFGHPGLIDRENILNATLSTMHRAVEALRPRPDLVLVDGRDGFQWPGMVVPVPQGDAHSLCIAAASIVAKVARDRMMHRMHGRFPQYHFDKNKGYGTKDHIEAISRHGAAVIHRRSFLLKIVEKTPTMF
jgi:ribonuclease HII